MAILWYQAKTRLFCFFLSSSEIGCVRSSDVMVSRKVVNWPFSHRQEENIVLTFKLSETIFMPFILSPHLLKLDVTCDINVWNSADFLWFFAGYRCQWEWPDCTTCSQTLTQERQFYFIPPCTDWHYHTQSQTHTDITFA